MFVVFLYSDQITIELFALFQHSLTNEAEEPYRHPTYINNLELPQNYE